MSLIKPIPDGYPRISPYLCVRGAAAAIDFYRTVFGAAERMRRDGPEGRVGHAELQIGDGVILLADEHPEIGARSPRAFGGPPVIVSIYVDDVDAVFERALAAGAKAVRGVENHFYGDRTGQFEDPFAHRWSVATHVEDVPPDEWAGRAAAHAGGQ